MSFSLAPNARFYVFNAGKAAAGAKLYTKNSITNANLPTYSDDQGTQNTNPVIMDADGGASVWLLDDVVYRFDVHNSVGALIYTQDGIKTNPTGGGGGLSFVTTDGSLYGLGTALNPLGISVVGISQVSGLQSILTDIDTAIANKVSKAGDTMTGNLHQIPTSNISVDHKIQSFDDNSRVYMYSYNGNSNVEVSSTTGSVVASSSIIDEPQVVVHNPDSTLATTITADEVKVATATSDIIIDANSFIIDDKNPAGGYASSFLIGRAIGGITQGGIIANEAYAAGSTQRVRGLSNTDSNTTALNGSVSNILNAGSGGYNRVTSATNNTGASSVAVSSEHNSTRISADEQASVSQVELRNNSNYIRVIEDDAQERIELTHGVDVASLLIPFTASTSKTLATTDQIPAAESTGDNSTGLLTWTSNKFIFVDSTHVTIFAGTGQVVQTNGTKLLLSWADQINVLDAHVGTSSNTYYMIGPGNILVQSATYPTPQDLRDYVYLGFTVHQPFGTISAIVPDPQLAINEMSQVRDIVGAMGFINKGIVASPYSTTLEIQTSQGYLYGLGLGYTADAADPSRKLIAATSPTTFQYRTQTGAYTGNLTSLEVGFYDVAGTRTAISGTRYSTQRIYVSPSGAVRIQYGQVTYTTMALAVAAIPTENYNVYTAFGANLQLVGLVTVRSTATDLSSSAQAVFTKTSIFGESTGASSGTSTTTLQQAYDNSVEPEILTDATRGALSLKRGSAIDNDHVIEVANGAGATTFSVRGTGLVNSATLDASAWVKTDSSKNLITNSPTTLLGFGITDALDTSATVQTKVGEIILNPATNGDIFDAKTNGTSKFKVSDSAATSTVPLTLPAGVTASPSMIIGAYSSAYTGSTDGAIFKSAADSLQVQMAGNKRTVGFLEKSQTWSSTQTFGTITSTGVATARAMVLTRQANTPSGTTYALNLTNGNMLALTLTSSTGNVTITTSNPTAGALTYLHTIGHDTLARDVSLTQSGVTWIYGGATYATTVNLGTTAINKKVLYDMYWVSATLCMIERMASDDGITIVDTGISSQIKVGALTIDKVATGTLFEVKNNSTSKLLVTDAAITANVDIITPHLKLPIGYLGVATAYNYTGTTRYVHVGTFTSGAVYYRGECKFSWSGRNTVFDVTMVIGSNSNVTSITDVDGNIINHMGTGAHIYYVISGSSVDVWIYLDTPDDYGSVHNVYYPPNFTYVAGSTTQSGAPAGKVKLTCAIQCVTGAIYLTPYGTARLSLTDAAVTASVPVIAPNQAITNQSLTISSNATTWDMSLGGKATFAQQVGTATTVTITNNISDSTCYMIFKQNATTAANIILSQTGTTFSLLGTNTQTGNTLTIPSTSISVLNGYYKLTLNWNGTNSCWVSIN